MKFSRELQSTGRLSTRKNEDRGKPEHQVLKDTSLHQAAICLHQAAICLQCSKAKCIGTDKCFREEVRRHGKSSVDG